MIHYHWGHMVREITLNINDITQPSHVFFVGWCFSIITKSHWTHQAMHIGRHMCSQHLRDNTQTTVDTLITKTTTMHQYFGMHLWLLRLRFANCVATCVERRTRLLLHFVRARSEPHASGSVSEHGSTRLPFWRRMLNTSINGASSSISDEPDSRT